MVISNRDLNHEVSSTNLRHAIWISGSHSGKCQDPSCVFTLVQVQRSSVTQVNVYRSTRRYVPWTYTLLAVYSGTLRGSYILLQLLQQIEN
jgi:hypothetical protein